MTKYYLYIHIMSVMKQRLNVELFLIINVSR